MVAEIYVIEFTDGASPALEPPGQPPGGSA